jgi:hypothetical protein
MHFTTEFNWLFDTRFEPELEELQHSAIFCLLILHRKATRFTDENELAGYFADAFPVVLEQLIDYEHPKWGRTATRMLEHGFNYLFLKEFCWFFGLVLRRKVKNDDSILRSYEYKKSKLFNKLFSWKL